MAFVYIDAEVVIADVVASDDLVVVAAIDEMVRCCLCDRSG